MDTRHLFGRVDKDPDSWGGRGTINPGDVLNDNASSPYSFTSEPSKSYKWWVHTCRSWGCSEAQYSNFTCGSCPQSPVAQSPSNGVSIACTTSNVVELTWTGPAGSKFNIRVSGDGVSSTDNITNTCSAHSICVDGLTDQSFKVTVQPGKSYTWWVDLQSPSGCGYITTGVKTFTTASCNPPKINSLYIRDAITNTQKDGVRISGKSSDQGGKDFNNPLLVTLDATAGQAKTTSYYVAFYAKSEGVLNNVSNFPSFNNQSTSAIQTRLNDLKNGVLLRYDEDTGGTNKKYYVWARDHWENLANYARSGLPLCNAQNILSECVKDSNRLYTVFPTSNPRQWRLIFDKNFGDKSMFTTAIVSDSNNLSAFRAGDMTPE